MMQNQTYDKQKECSVIAAFPKLFAMHVRRTPQD